MEKHLKVGIIGTGFGKMIALNFKAVDPTVDIYFSGRDKKKLKAVSDEVVAQGIFEKWEDLVTDQSIDLVVIASHSSAHKEMFDLAAKSRKHILVEKPAALTSAEIGEMDNAFKDKDKFAIVNHEGRFNPVVTYIHEQITTEKLGDIMTVRIGTYSNWYSSPDYKENWNQDVSLGGGQVYSIGTHQLDLARFLLSSPVIISGAVQKIAYQDKRFSKTVTAESQFSAQFQTADNTSIQLFNDCYCFGYKDFTIDVVGSNGAIFYSDQRGLKSSYSNSEPLQDIQLVDPMPGITLGNSILSKSMKYMIKSLIDRLNGVSEDNRFCTLKEAKKNLEVFEKFR